jgi:hypothetical protein
VKDEFLSSGVGLARAMETQLASTCIKAEKTVFWERLILVGY